MADRTYTIELNTTQVPVSAEQAAQSIQALETELGELEAAFARGGVHLGNFNQQHAQLSTQLNAAKGAASGFGGSVQQAYGVTQQASSATARYASELQKSGQAAGRSGAAGGILLLSQVVDDAQYGFRAIVNQIPQVGIAVGTAFGASVESSAAFGGALGLLGVAINLNLKQLDEWGTLLEGARDTAPIKAVEESFWGVVNAVNGYIEAASTAVGIPLSFSVAGIRAREADKATEAGRQKESATAQKAIEGVVSPEQQGRAKAFKEAVEGEEGGGKSLRERLIRDQIRKSGRADKDLDKEFRLPGGTTTTKRKQITEGIDLTLAAGLRGEQPAIEDIAGRLPGGAAGPFAQRFDAATPAGKAAVKEEEERIKRESKEAEAANAAYQKRIDDQAKTLAAGRIGTRILSGETPIVADIQAELEKSGVDVGPQEALDVTDRLSEMVEGGVADRALEKGITQEDAAAALLKERTDKEDKASKEAFDAELKSAKQKDPLLDARLKNAITMGFASGGQIGAEVAGSQVLQKAGVGGGLDYIKGLAGEEQRSVFEQMTKGGEKPRAVQTFADTASYLNAIQEGVGGERDTPQKQLQEQQRTNALLQQIMQRGGSLPGAVFGFIAALMSVAVWGTHC